MAWANCVAYPVEGNARARAWDKLSKNSRAFFVSYRTQSSLPNSGVHWANNIHFEMKEKDKNEELQSRRDFFKKAAKAALPIVAAVALSSMPVVAQSLNHEANRTTDCYGACGYSCHGSCQGYCEGTCQGGCKDTCHGSCVGTCTTSCHYTCSGVSY